MARKKKHAHGGHGWFVTFADLMGLLMSFFVVVAAFSTIDNGKLQAMLGSVRDAMGVSPESRRSGVVELGGTPQRQHLRDVGQTVAPGDLVVGPGHADAPPMAGPDARASGDTARQRAAMEQAFGTTAASLRQAWQDMPEIQAISRNITFEITNEGLAISLVDQDNRAMFPEGSKFPFDRTRRVLELLAPALSALPNPIEIAGHTSSRRQTGRIDYDNFELSSDRAHSVRKILMESGVPSSRFRNIHGRGDTMPLFPSNPGNPANARVTIVLTPIAPPMAPGSIR